jgi:hypothetical protein
MIGIQKCSLLLLPHWTSRTGDPKLEPTKTQLPVIITPAEITPSDVHASLVVPALIANIGNDASWRYVEFFTANIRNPHTRRAYARACARFFVWCDEHAQEMAAHESPPHRH